MLSIYPNPAWRDEQFKFHGAVRDSYTLIIPILRGICPRETTVFQARRRARAGNCQWALVARLCDQMRRAFNCSDIVLDNGTIR